MRRLPERPRAGGPGQRGELQCYPGINFQRLLASLSLFLILARHRAALPTVIDRSTQASRSI